MAADGVIYSAPIYSRLLPGKLRLLADRVFGPHADVGFIRLLMEREAAGEPITVPFTPDERVLRPRVAAFIAVGGALTDQWGTLALPMMHSLAFSMRSGVVDQVLLLRRGHPPVDRARSGGARARAAAGAQRRRAARAATTRRSSTAASRGSVRCVTST